MTDTNQSNEQQIIRYLNAELLKEQAATRALTTQRDELNQTVKQYQTPPYKLYDVVETSVEYKRYSNTNRDNVRFHRTTDVKRAAILAATLELFRGRRESVLAQHNKDRHSIFKLTQKIAILENQVEADTEAGVLKAAADEAADRLAQLREQFEEAHNVHEVRNDIRQKRKRGRSLQLGEDLEEDVERDPTPQAPASDRYSALTDFELLNITRARGTNLPDGTARSAIIGVLDASFAATSSAPATASASAPTTHGADIVFSDEELKRMFEAPASQAPSRRQSGVPSLSEEQIRIMGEYLMEPASRPGTRPVSPIPQPPPLEVVPGRQRLSRQVSPTSAQVSPTTAVMAGIAALPTASTEMLD